MLNESLTPVDYLESMVSETRALWVSVLDQMQELFSDGRAMTIQRIDDHEVEPSKLNGRGNLIFTCIHQLEHTVEQLEYLVGKGKLPNDFMDLAMRYKHVLIPKIAEDTVPGCVYFSKFDMSEACILGEGETVREVRTSGE